MPTVFLFCSSSSSCNPNKACSQLRACIRQDGDRLCPCKTQSPSHTKYPEGLGNFCPWKDSVIQAASVFKFYHLNMWLYPWLLWQRKRVLEGLLSVWKLFISLPLTVHFPELVHNPTHLQDSGEECPPVCQEETSQIWIPKVSTRRLFPLPGMYFSLIFTWLVAYWHLDFISKAVLRCHWPPSYVTCNSDLVIEYPLLELE